MHTDQAGWISWPSFGYVEAKESTVKLAMEVHHYEGVSVVHCRGRITYRDEAAQLSATAGDLLSRTRNIILEMSDVETMDSAGLGELAVLLMWSQAYECEIKIAAPRPHVRNLLELTNLVSVVRIFPTIEDAMCSAPGQAA